jgi:ATP-binding protein involved in chromosome partitioning
MTLAQDVMLSGIVIAATPQEVSLEDARKAVAMFDKLGVSIFGIIENMSSEIFGEGGGENAADDLGLDFLGSIPLEKELRIGSDKGVPLTAINIEHPVSIKFLEIAKKIDQRCVIVNEQSASLQTRDLT